MTAHTHAPHNAAPAGAVQYLVTGITAAGEEYDTWSGFCPPDAIHAVAQTLREVAAGQGVTVVRVVIDLAL